jgi:hypothetical protein
MSRKTKELDFQVSSGNVFADMELEDADQLYALAQLGFQVHRVKKRIDYSWKFSGIDSSASEVVSKSVSETSFAAIFASIAAWVWSSS